MAFARSVATTHTKTLISPSTGSADKVYGVDYVSATSHTSTGAVSGAVSGGIPYFDSTTTEAVSALLGASAIVMGGGAGAAPFTDITNFVYTSAGSLGGGPTLKFGSGTTTSTGWIWGGFGSGYGAMWASGLTPSSSNYTMLTLSSDNADLRINTTTTGKLCVAGNATLGWDSAALRLGTGAKVFMSVTAPTIASGFGTSPSISASNGTAAFTLTIGTATTGISTGTLTLPAAFAGWVCSCNNITNAGSFIVQQTGGSQTTITLQNYSRTTGVAADFTASDVIRISAMAY